MVTTCNIIDFIYLNRILNQSITLSDMVIRLQDLDIICDVVGSYYIKKIQTGDISLFPEIFSSIRLFEIKYDAKCFKIFD